MMFKKVSLRTYLLTILSSPPIMAVLIPAVILLLVIGCGQGSKFVLGDVTGDTTIVSSDDHQVYNPGGVGCDTVIKVGVSDITINCGENAGPVSIVTGTTSTMSLTCPMTNKVIDLPNPSTSTITSCKGTETVVML